MHQHRTDAFASTDRASFDWPLGPRTTTLLWASAGACVGHALGMEWLTDMVLGVPAGLWLVGSVTYLAHVRTRRATASSGQEAGESAWALPKPIGAAVQHTTEAFAAAVSWLAASLSDSERWRYLKRVMTRRVDVPMFDVRLPELSGRARFPRLHGVQELRAALNAPAQAATDALTHAAAEVAGGMGASVKRLKGARASGVDRPIRIGLDVREAEFNALTSASSRLHLDPQAFTVTRHAPGAFVDSAREIERVDALVRRSPDNDRGLYAFLPEDEAWPAAWYDWSIEPPLCFASVFPARLDCARLTLGACDLSRVVQAELVGALVAAAAAYARHPARTPGSAWSLCASPTAAEMQTVVARQHQAMAALAEAFDRLVSDSTERSVAPKELLTSASNVLSAWCSTQDHQSSGGKGSGVCAERRMQLAALASEGFEKHAPQVLRLAAAQLAAGQDDDALRSLQWAVRVLRSAHAECSVDPLVFVQSEIELGQPGGLSTGRIAAGLTLLWATTDSSRHPFLREDLADDLRHAGWLMGRDHDRGVIERVMQLLSEMDEGAESELTQSHLSAGYASTRAAA